MHKNSSGLKKILTSRSFLLGAVIVLLMIILTIRVFMLQIVNGEDYQENFILYIEKNLTTDATRGSIYDCNGVLLAGNELSFTVKLADSGTYSRTSVKNEQLNAEIASMIAEIHRNGDTLYNSFKIDRLDDGTYAYNTSGSGLTRFLADVFGRASSSDLKYNADLGFNEETATAEQVMDYLKSDVAGGYAVSGEYDEQTAYEIVTIRYALSQYSYSRYYAVTVAEDVSDATVAFIEEHADELIGASIEEETRRVYYDSTYFASIIGYTGTISDEEYARLSETDDSYKTTDVVGKAGLEQYYESDLRGQNGEQTIYVDNVGKISQVISETEPVAGSDLYLTIDSSLQEAAYCLLEEEIAGIVYTNIQNGNITPEEVYFALLDNNVIDIGAFKDEPAGSYQQAVYAVFADSLKETLGDIESELFASRPLSLNEMPDQLSDAFTRILSMLKEEDILLSDKIDTDDATYQKWVAGSLSPQEYLTYCICEQWIDVSLLKMEESYFDLSEAYDALCAYILLTAEEDKEFAKIVYQYLLYGGFITGRQICLIALEQGAVDDEGGEYAALEDYSLSAYDFILDKINTLAITPAQLALDPCTGSVVVTDADTGEIKALVSYPGYDNNEMANGVNAVYYEALRQDHSNPLYNYATQERTAPGSTFKMVTATAGLAEGVIDRYTIINCTGIFKDISNEPTCWIYPGKHGGLNLIGGLRESCNYYFYSVGYWLSSQKTGTYNDKNGIDLIQKYARIYGMDELTGLEIEENQSRIATQYPVMAAIGQSDNNYTTVSLSRYVTAVATGHLYSYQLMDKIVDESGQVERRHSVEYEDISDTLSDDEWSAIYEGMREVVKSSSEFKDLKVSAAGKTGTAQQVSTRPNHALFVGYAPYEDPEITVSVRISYGYNSHNASAVAAEVMEYYFGELSMDEIKGRLASDEKVSISTSTAD